MFAIALIAISCVGIVAILALGYRRIEEEREERPAAVARGAPPPPGRCVLCDAPLRRRTTPAEVLYELEHHIDEELQDIGTALRGERDGFTRLYRA